MTNTLLQSPLRNSIALPAHVDSTMISCFRGCPQKFLLEFVRGFRPPGISIDLHAGGCYASALEETYKGIHESGLPLSDAMLRAHARFLVEWGDFIIPEYKKTAKTKDRTWDAIESYFTSFPPLTDHVQPYFLDGKPTFETTFAIPLEPACNILPNDPSTNKHNFELGYFPLHPSGEPFIYSGRFDMVGTYEGRPCVKDDKTTGSTMSTGWSEKWDLRSQFLGYVWACQQMGMDLDTVVVRGTSILKTKIDHAEAVKVYSQALVARWHEQLRRDLWRMRRMWDEGYFDYNLADACTQYGSCIFLPMCQSVDPEVWTNQYEVRHWNPLAKDPTKSNPQGSESAADLKLELTAPPPSPLDAITALGGSPVGVPIPDTRTAMEVLASTSLGIKAP